MSVSLIAIIVAIVIVAIYIKRKNMPKMSKAPLTTEDKPQEQPDQPLPERQPEQESLGGATKWWKKTNRGAGESGDVFA